MECDDELAEELGLISDDIITDEEDDEELVTETSIETEARGKKPYRNKDIALWSGYKYKKTYNNDPEDGFICKKKRGTKRALFKLKQQHAKWIISYIDDKPTAVLDQISESLCGTFETETLSVSGSALHRFVRVYCALSMNRLEKIPARRNHIDVIEQRKLAVELWLDEADLITSLPASPPGVDRIEFF
ncbi:hypothetical protein INT47_005381 [Mucor saturninus]|uniref:Uncharacterized protein n=1 Tax=Mucor saturninus TaxID=64648 RepID=A0A8H7UVF3_9FUNG|nr:hypothetical protein INT47_005381 [Mucor saturninus]